jgi:hypothetical protein
VVVPAAQMRLSCVRPGELASVTFDAGNTHNSLMYAALNRPECRLVGPEPPGSHHGQMWAWHPACCLLVCKPSLRVTAADTSLSGSEARCTVCIWAHHRPTTRSPCAMHCICICICMLPLAAAMATKAPKVPKVVYHAQASTSKRLTPRYHGWAPPPVALVVQPAKFDPPPPPARCTKWRRLWLTHHPRAHVMTASRCLVSCCSRHSKAHTPQQARYMCDVSCGSQQYRACR